MDHYISWLKLFKGRFGLPFQQIGITYTFPDGTRTVAAQASLTELERAIREGSPKKFQWYREGLNGHAPPVETPRPLSVLSVNGGRTTFNLPLTAI